mgnify:CR=1 FL=1
MQRHLATRTSVRVVIFFSVLPFLYMLIVSNWKAYVESTTKSKALYAIAKKGASGRKHTLVLLVPAPYLGLLAAPKQQVLLGAQDISVTLGGATTGEVTAGLVAELGAQFVLVGHSERRAMGEQDETILEKTKHALAHGLTPILCVGERERDLDAKYLKEVRTQLASVFSSLTKKECAQMIVAYEPLWAIGKTALDAITPEDLREMVLYIRKVLTDYLPGRVRVLYGGSTEAENVSMLAQGSEIDGFLIGHASADQVSYAALLKALA